MARPLGSKNKDKPWTDALRAAVTEADGVGVKRLRRIADACVNAAMNGDMQAVREIGDRLDGKPAQESTVTHIRDVAQMTDMEIAQRLAELRGDSSPGDDAMATVDPSQLN
jgi:hypothetical protein